MVKVLQIAGRAGIENLYHYQQFDPDRLADLLLNHRVYCSTPTDFNDPWDCKPFFNLDVADDPVMHRQVAESFIATQKGGPQGDSMDEELRRSPQLVKMLLKNFNDEVGKKLVPSHWRVYCVAREPDSSLMWSHYSRNHTGVCLEFKVPGTKFAHAWEIEYQKEYPLFTFGDLTDVIRMLIVKSDVWAYERNSA